MLLKKYVKPEIKELNTASTFQPGKSGKGQESGKDKNSGPATVS
jgi:hypothetical protein